MYPPKTLFYCTFRISAKAYYDWIFTKFTLFFSDSAEYLVRVKAQVMTRDDSTGGWVPMGGGGVSIVGLRKRVHPTAQQDDMRHEYLINGQRMSDNSVSTQLYQNGKMKQPTSCQRVDLSNQMTSWCHIKTWHYDAVFVCRNGRYLIKKINYRIFDSRDKNKRASRPRRLCMLSCHSSLLTLFVGDW